MDEKDGRNPCVAITFDDERAYLFDVENSFLP